MTLCINNSGTYRNIITLCVNNSGTYRNITSGCINQSGTYRLFGPLVPCAPYEGGFLICRASPVRWIVSPYSAEVSRTWGTGGPDEGVTRAQQVSGCTGWFLPDCAQLKDPGYCCKSFWGPSPCYSEGSYYSTSGAAYKKNYSVNFVDGTVGQFCTSGSSNSVQCVRVFRCVTY